MLRLFKKSIYLIFMVLLTIVIIISYNSSSKLSNERYVIHINNMNNHINRKINQHKHVMFAILLYLCVIALLLLTVPTMVNNLLNDISPKGKYNPSNEDIITLETPLTLDTFPKRLRTSEITNDQNAVRMTIVAEQVLPVERKTQITINIEVPDQIKSSLLDGRSLDPIAVHTNRASSFTLKSEYSQMLLTIHTRNKLNSLNTSVTIPVDTIFNNTITSIDNRAFSTSLTLPLNGQHNLYPSDWYHGAWLIDIELPEPLVLHGKEYPGFNYFLPIEPLVTSSVSMGDTIIYVPRSTVQSNFIADLDLLITRSQLTTRYVYAIAMIPFILGLTLVHFLFFHRSSKQISYLELIIGLAAFAVAVLPLREVLIPSEITGLTRIDYILGLEIVFLVSVILCKYASDLFKTR